MRIVGGKFRGRALAAPKSNAIRPTSDRVRETLFNILMHSYESHILNARILDGFAGTGALGLEALSRGASYALFVDDGIEARALIRENVQTLGVAACTKLLNRSVLDMGPCHPFAPFDALFLDPPYNKGLGEAAIQHIISNGWLKPEALIILEEATSAEIQPIEGTEILDQRIIGDTQVVILTCHPRA